MSKTLRNLIAGLFAGLVLFSGGTIADITYNTIGKIASIDRQRIYLSDISYRLLATTKIVGHDNTRMTLSDLKPGSIVSLTILKLDGKYLVDSIVLIER